MTETDINLRHYWGFIFLVALMGALPPLSTDMYLAAIPHIADQWGVSSGLVNLSLVLWFVSFSVCLLIFGSLSDQLGRRPVLIGGVVLFTIASALCAYSENVQQLIAFRILQGASAAAPSAMCLATCRDRFEGRLRQRVLAWMGIIVGIAPMVAPSIGAFILKYADWKLIFKIQASLGFLLSVLVIFIFKESAKTLEKGGVWNMLLRYFRLLKNRNFILTNCSMSLINAPIFGFIAFSTTLYITIYGLSEYTFAVLFSANAVMAMIGSFVSTRLIRYYADQSLITVCLIGCTTAGVLLLILGGYHYLVGESNYLLFAATMAMFTFFAGMSRPLSNHLILEQVLQDIGAASSTIIFTQFLVGAMCMAYATATWKYPIFTFGLSVLLLPGAVLVIWPFLKRRLN